MTDLVTAPPLTGYPALWSDIEELADTGWTDDPRVLDTFGMFETPTAGTDLTSEWLVDVSVLPLDRFVTHFTQSACWLLAITLGEMFGLPVLNLGDWHAVIGDGDGNVYDIDGWHRADDNPTFKIEGVAANDIDRWVHDFDCDEIDDWVQPSNAVFSRRIMRDVIVPKLLAEHPIGYDIIG